METKIIALDHMGRGITKIDNKITFIPKTIKDDIVDIALTKNKKNYNEGKLLKIIKESKDRVPSKCIYYDICGGCNISNLPYQKQLFL